jgi:ParB family chromosome partitioning protein
MWEKRDPADALDFAERAYFLINSCGYSQERIGIMLGVDTSTISNTIRLRELPEEVKSELRSGTISQSHAQRLLPLRKHPELCLDVLHRILKVRLSVRQVEVLVREVHPNPEHMHGNRYSRLHANDDDSTGEPT